MIPRFPLSTGLLHGLVTHSWWVWYHSQPSSVDFQQCYWYCTYQADCTIVYRCTCCTHGDGWSLTFFQILQWYSLYLHVGLHVWHWLSMQRTLSGDVNRSQFWPVPPRNLLQVLMLIQSSETSLFSHVEQLNVLQYLVGLSVQPCDAL